MRPPSNCSLGFVLLAGFVLSGFGLQAQQAAPQAGAGLAAPEQQQPLTVDRDPVLSPDPTPAAPPPPAAPTAGNGGTPTVQRNNGHYTLERTVDEVVLNATVLDDKDHVVNSLTQADFKVYEDNVPQTIVSFQHQDIPISLGLLVDNSGSMRSKRQAVNESALDLVRASNPDDESFVVNFSDEAYIDQDFTADVGKLRDGLSHIDSRGGTALYDAVVASADYMSKNAKRPKQVLLVITDGEDNASSTSLEQTVRRIQDLQGPVVYCIGLLFNSDDGGRESRRARRALQLLSDETGGLAFFPKNLDQVDEIAGEVAHDIRQQYTIGYRSTKPASLGGYRAVRLEAKAQGLGKLTVRTKPGYFPTAKPQTASASNSAGN
ncbi:MAG TPA: VWA domain-containing protein [Acidobacteriaceae bacterium]|nr:VWA domain-containing protein [Acidobacteriaceae bacterium]